MNSCAPRYSCEACAVSGSRVAPSQNRCSVSTSSRNCVHTLKHALLCFANGPAVDYRASEHVPERVSERGPGECIRRAERPLREPRAPASCRSPFRGAECMFNNAHTSSPFGPRVERAFARILRSLWRAPRHSFRAPCSRIRKCDNCARELLWLD